MGEDIQGNLSRNTPSMVALVEIHCPIQRAELFWNKLGYVVAPVSKAQGKAGGIWVFVEKKIISLFHWWTCIAKLRLLLLVEVLRNGFARQFMRVLPYLCMKLFDIISSSYVFL